MKSEAGAPLPTSLVTPKSRSFLLPGRCSRQLRNSCAGVNKRAERMTILEHYFASKLFAAVREAFSSVYPEKKYRILQQYTDC
jgi:hypothetical protein